MATKPILTRINAQLKKAGHAARLVRGRGYYYLTGVAASSGLYVMWLDNASESDYELARDHVNAVLLKEQELDGTPAVTLN